jgi:hypothetical protein
LNADFIEANGLSWIDNLETSSGGRLDDPRHTDHRKPYVQTYIREFGVRKCEANPLVVTPEAGRQLCRDAILQYVPPPQSGKGLSGQARLCAEATAVGAARRDTDRKVSEPAMGARQSTYRTRDLTQAIVGIRRAGLGICRVEIEGKITVHISNGPPEEQVSESNGGANECDAILDRIEKQQAKEGG